MGLGANELGVGYVSLVTFLTLCAIIDNQSNSNDQVQTVFGVTRTRVFILRLAFFVLWFMAAFRGMLVANDTQSYYRTYIKIAESGLQSENRMEIGYVLLNALISQLFSDNETGFRVLLFISACVAYYPLEQWIERHCSAYDVCLLAFYFLFNASYMSAIRQSMAVGIVLLALMGLEKGHKKAYFVLMVIAVLFHSSAIAAVIFYLLRSKRFGLESVMIWMLITAGCVELNLVAKVMQVIKPSTSYIISEVENSANVLATTGLYAALLLLNFLPAKQCAREIVDIRDGEMDFTSGFFAHCILLSLSVSLMSLRAPVLSRIVMYMTITGMPYVSISMNRLENDNLAALIKIIFVVAIWMYSLIVLIYRPEWAHIWPYYFYWME